MKVTTKVKVTIPDADPETGRPSRYREVHLEFRGDEVLVVKVVRDEADEEKRRIIKRLPGPRPGGMTTDEILAHTRG